MDTTEALAPIATDAVVIGAGPVGLFQVFQLGLLDIRAHLVDALPHAGGQCIELYPDKPIYDVPGVPVCTGRELVERLLTQVRPMAPTLHLGQRVTSVQPLPDGRLDVLTSAGIRLVTKTLFIAAGVGAFQTRPLKLDGIEAFEPTQLRYRLGSPADHVGQHVMVLGGDDLAVDAAIALADAAAGPGRVSLLHRRDVFQAHPAAQERLQALRAAGRVEVVVGQPMGFEASEGRLTALQVLGSDSLTRSVEVDVLLPMLGLSPKLGPIADWGLTLARKQLVVDTATFATNVPGIYAVGDINTYPGKKKLLVCGFHEAALAAFAASARVFGQEVALQYTTTSSKLHRLLGVDHPV